MSILLVMWAAKQTKKGVSKADTAMKRRNRKRMEKRMTKLGITRSSPSSLHYVQEQSSPRCTATPEFSRSLPDLSEEDPFEDQCPEEYLEDTWDPISYPTDDRLSTLTAAAEAVAKVIAYENEARKSYNMELELRRSLNIPRERDANGFLIDSKSYPMPALQPAAIIPSGTDTTRASKPKRAHTTSDEKYYERASMSEVREGLSRTDDSFKDLHDEKDNFPQSMKPGKTARTGSRLLKRMSHWSLSAVHMPLRANKALKPDLV